MINHKSLKIDGMENESLVLKLKEITIEYISFLNNTNMGTLALDGVAYDLSLQLYRDISRWIDETEITRYKMNRHNLTIFTDGYKIKVYFGVVANIAKRNFDIANEFSSSYFDECFVGVSTSPTYRLEVFKFIKKHTVADSMMLENATENNPITFKLANSKFTHVLNVYKDWLYNNVLHKAIGSERDHVVMSNDLNPGNFIVEQYRNGDFFYLNIDYDHMQILNRDHAINNAAYQFITRFYDKTEFPDDAVSSSLVDFRNKYDLVEAVEDFKADIHDTIKSNYDRMGERYLYKMELPDFNNNEELYNSYIRQLQNNYEVKSITQKIWGDIEYYDKYAFVVSNDDIKVFEDMNRPSRKIKAEFVEDSGHYKQQDWDMELLQRGMYLTNTEDISSEVDGLIYKSDVDVYVSVAAGLKGLIKGAVDNGDNFEYIYADISPAAIDFRIFVDNKLKEDHKRNLDDIWEEYMDLDHNRPLPLFANGYDSIEVALDDYLEQVNIDRTQWYDFLKKYAECDKKYIKIDLINNVKLLTKLIQSDKKVWFWYSNTFDWHQFRHSENSYNAWVSYLKRSIPNLDLCGHTPPFTSQKIET